MKKLTAAAALLAAGMTTFAAHSQEAPARMLKQQQTKTTTQAGNKEKPVAKTAAVRTGRQLGTGTPIDTMTTAAIAPKPAAIAPKPAAIAPKPAAIAPKPAAARASKPAAARAPKPAARPSKPAASGNRYDTIIRRYASAYDIPVSLAHAVIFVESNYRANARGSAGEIGLMQIKPGTARMMGYSGSSKGLFNPETNIKYGMKYLAKAHKLGGGSTCRTILKYNAGHAARRMNPVSAAYCSKVKRRIGG